MSLFLILLASPSLAQERPRIGAGDAVTITVVDQANLSKKFVVSENGTLQLDLVGVFQVDGLTSDQLEADLRRRLGAFLVNPRVQVQVEPASRVFVFGAVKVPGSLNLTENMTLLEALSRSGYSGSTEVVVVRPQSRGPAPIDAADAQVIRVNLRELEKDVENGELGRNLLLRDSDTIYVPAEDPNRIYVSGEVKTPGPYSIPEGTTVLQALSLAGGVTEDAAVGRLRVTRVIEGELKSLKVSADDAVEAGDTVTVPKSIPLPAIDVGLPPADGENLPGQIHFGNALSIRPVFAVKQLGVDNNVFNDAEMSSDFTFVAGPRLEVAFELARLEVNANADVDFQYFRRFESERSINSYTRVTVSFVPVNRFRLTVGGNTADTRERIDTLIDQRLRRFERTFDVAAQFRPLRKFDVTFSGRDFDRVVDDAQVLGGVAHSTLTERVRSVTTTARFAITPLTDLVVAGSATTHRFDFYPIKDADATEFTIGGVFKPGALLLGDARIGYLRYLGLDDLGPDLETVVGSGNLFWDIAERTRLGMTLERTTGNTFQPDFSHSLIDRLGGSLRQGLSQRYDMLLETYREKHTFSRFGRPGESVRPPDLSETVQRYVGEIGVRVGPLRVGVNVTNMQRLSTVTTRGYNAVRVMMNVSYGVFQARVL